MTPGVAVWEVDLQDSALALQVSRFRGTGGRLQGVVPKAGRPIHKKLALSRRSQLYGQVLTSTYTYQNPLFCRFRIWSSV